MTNKKMKCLNDIRPFGVCFKNGNQLTDINISEILEFLKNRFLVVIKGFTFGKIDDYLHFLEQLGRPFMGHMWCSHPRSNAVQVVTNRKIFRDNKPGLFSKAKLGWHTNGIFSDNPEQIVCLYCKMPGNSATQFLNTSLAVRHIRQMGDMDIDDIMVEITNDNSKTLLKEDRVFDPLPKEEHIDISRHRHRDKGMENSIYANRESVQTKSFVQKHPLSQIEGCFFPKLNVSGLFSKKNHKSRNKDFSRLCNLIFRKEFIYTHQWEKGDMILCDQILTLHRRSRYEGERELYRSALWYH